MFMAEYLIQGDTLTAIANAIRGKTGDTAMMTAADMAVAIESIETGVDTSDATATAAQILTEKTAYVKGSKVTGTMANNGAVSQTLNTSATSYTIPAGYHDGTGKVSLITETKTVTPKKSSQTVTPTSGKVLSKVTVNGDANLIAENIKSGISIFGVDGSLSSGAQFATGTFTPSSTSISTTGTNVSTINGLAFTPKQVIIWNAVTQGMSGTRVHRGFRYVIGVFTGHVNMKLYGGNPSKSTDDVSSEPIVDDNCGLTVIENGFTWTINQTFSTYGVKGLELSSSYSYLAIA